MRFLCVRARCFRSYRPLDFDRGKRWLLCRARVAFLSQELFLDPTRLSTLLQRSPRTATFIGFRSPDTSGPHRVVIRTISSGALAKLIRAK